MTTTWLDVLPSTRSAWPTCRTACSRRRAGPSGRRADRRLVLDAGAASEQAGMESGDVWLQPSLNAFLAEDGRPGAAPGSG